jgi:hypothetical protein
VTNAAQAAGVGAETPSPTARNRTVGIAPWMNATLLLEAWSHGPICQV